MTVLDRSELQASPLSDLHSIADQIGLEGFRRLRKADLIDAILGEKQDDAAKDTSEEETPRRSSTRRSRGTRSRRGAAGKAAAEDQDSEEDEKEDRAAEPAPSTRRGGRSAGGRARGEREKPAESERTAKGVVEVLGNGSAFLRVDPPEPSDEDIYISAAQVRRCELASGDEVSGPVRTPRRSERYSSLVRIDTINGQPADAVSEGIRYEDLPVSYPSERLAFDSEDPTLKAIEWLTPLGRGSRAVIAGGARAGKTVTLRRILAALAEREGFEISLVLAGVRPEEVAEWREGPLQPTATVGLASSPDVQGQAVEAAVEAAKRVASRGGDAVVLIDGLDGLHPHSARKALAAARNLSEAGSLTVIATAAHAFGGETTVIALDPVRAGMGRFPALDLIASGTLKPELLVGEDGAEAISKARESAAEG